MNKIYEKQAPDALGERVKGPFWPGKAWYTEVITVCKFAWGPRFILGGKQHSLDSLSVWVGVLATNHLKVWELVGLKTINSFRRELIMMKNSAQVTLVPIVAPRRPQEEEFPLNVNLSMDPHTLDLSGSSCLVPMVLPLGIMTGMNVKQKNWSLGAHRWPSTEIWTGRGILSSHEGCDLG